MAPIPSPRRVQRLIGSAKTWRRAGRWRSLPPHTDPGQPGSVGPAGYLWWVTRMQPGRALRGALWSCLWMTGLVLEPLFIRGAIDHGLARGELTTALGWAGAMVTVAIVTSMIGLLRHRTMTFLRTDAAYRTVQVVTRQVTRLGGALPRRVATGEVVTVGATDIWHVSQSLIAVGPGLAALVGVGAVSALVISISPLLGVVIVVGVPAVTIAVSPLLARLRRAETEYRRQQGELAARAGDIVAGLRVLRGIGGEALFTTRYRQGSRALRDQGYRVGGVISWVRALASGMPALFVAVVTWQAARMVVRGALSVGDMVAIYGYATILAIPVFFLLVTGHDLIRGLVAARRVVNLLGLRPDVVDRPRPRTGPARPADLHDPASGLRVAAGELIAVAGADQSALSALADRLGRYGETDATVGGVPLAELSRAEVRERILVAEGEAYLFAGTLRDMVCPAGEVDPALIERCLRTAAAEDIVDGLPERLDTRLGNQAKSLSGGQRQRVRLARALLADPEVLILLDPTSAVDAHTEAAIAERLRVARAGRTTVVTTTSPLLLDRADQVAYLAGGRVQDTGSHAELLKRCPSYRALVAREAGEPPDGELVDASSTAGPGHGAR